MKFSIHPSIIELFPEVKIGLLVVKGFDNQKNREKIVSLLRLTQQAIREKYRLEELSTLPKIADWREAYRKFGFKPSSHRSSVEALLRRILQGKELPSINLLVDLYNLISVKHILPVGCDDLDQVDGNITLTIAEGTENFIMLGAEKPEEIKKAEVIYRDDKEVLCRSWNYRECAKTKITENTKNVCLVLEGLSHTSQQELMSALSELKTLLSSCCEADFKEFFLYSGQLEALF
jgi:DNA/RNA-binding domain of Phe-tRNA-synthetase-like protein